ncbi:MAG: adenosylmethionine decarboxylase [Candidatus Lokiarchaeota archaeon]|nr:adenosylmethionine decarboxylase [Candidatus Harpocratesius repetitus]
MTDPQALGFHYLIELYECNSIKIQDSPWLEKLMSDTVKRSNSHEIGRVFHRFSPHGVSGVVLIAESHFSIHTWPEYGYVAIDLFTCSTDTDISLAYKYLVEQLEAKRHSITEIKRGLNLQLI